MIPVALPKAQYLARKTEIDQAVQAVLDSGDYVLGRHVEALETAFASYCGVAHAVGVSSGTDALTLALRALGVRPGDRVATVAHTALATVAAVLAARAVPVLVDVDPSTWTMDPHGLNRAMASGLAAIVPVHLYGNMADVTAIRALAGNVPIVEDCAQAPGAALDRQRAGSLGAAGCFSFYPTKNLGAIGDGGMVVTNDGELADRITRARQYGWDRERRASAPGVNSRLDELQAAILLAKLPYLDADNRRRRDIARRYTAAFADLPLGLPMAVPGVEPVHHLYVVTTPRREALRQALADRGVQTGIHYPVSAHREPAYRPLVELPPGGLPETETLAEQVMSLPLYPELTDDEVETVIEAVTSCAGALP